MAKQNIEKCKQLREYNNKWIGYFQDNNNRYHEYLDFVYAEEMWQTQERDALVKYNKIPLSFNKLVTIVNSIAGEQAQNDVQMQCIPLSEDLSPERIDLQEALLKRIAEESDSKMVYTSAFRQALAGGFGAFRIDHEYLSDKSFDQHITLHKVLDPTKCFWDMTAKSPGKTDGDYCGYYTYMSKKTFEQKYGKKIMNRMPAEMDGQVDNGPNFKYIDDNSICVLEIYEREYKKETIYELEDGRIVNEKELEELEEEQMMMDEIYPLLQQEMQQQQQALPSGSMPTTPMMQQPPMGEMQGPESMGVGNMQPQEQMPMDGQPPQGGEQDPMEGQMQGAGMPMQQEQSQAPQIAIRNSRKIDRDIIKHYKIGGDYILEESEFPAQSLPLVFVDQESYYTKTGAQVTRPFVQSAKDAQQFINYLGTQIAYLVKVSRYDQFMASSVNIQGPQMERIWRNPQQIQGTLIYNPDPENGTKPERLAPPELSGSLMQQYQRALQDIQTSTGVFETQLGAQGSEESGVAIDARTKRGNNNTYIVFDSLNRAITEAGRIINQMIPNVYDSPRNIMLERKSEGMQNIQVNKPTDDYGEGVENDLTAGEFKIKIKAGPSFEAQKTETLKSLEIIMQSGGQEIFPMVADLVAENLPVPNNIEIRNRLRTIVPQEILEAGKTGKPIPPKPPQPDPKEQALMMQQQNKQAELQIKQQQLQMEGQKAQSDLEINQEKLKLEYATLAAQLEKEQMQVAAEIDRTQAMTEIERGRFMSDILEKRAQGNYSGRSSNAASTK